MPVLESLKSYFEDNAQFDLVVAARELDELLDAAWSPECLKVHPYRRWSSCSWKS